MSAVVIEKAVVMDRFFTLRGQSAISDTPDFKIDKLAWGNGYVSNGVISAIPTNVSNIQGEFHRSDAILTYSNGTYTIRGIIAKGELADNVNAEFNTLYVLDAHDNILALLVVMPVTMNKTRGLTIEGVINEGHS